MRKNFSGINYRCGRIARIVTLTLSALLLCGAASAGTVRLTASDNGRALTLVRGDFLIVSLASTPGAGYGWKVAHIDRDLLRQAGNPQLIKNPNPVPGAPATQVFRFKAARRGSTRLELAYVRPWERGVAPARTFRALIRIR